MPRKSENGKKEIPKDDHIYKEKRNKNNEAVKRSRQKTKVNDKETMDKVRHTSSFHLSVFSKFMKKRKI